MNDYIKVRVDFEPAPTADVTDLLAAFLADEGFESFEPDSSGLNAYVKAELFDAESPARAISLLPFEGYSAGVTTEHIEGRDWNAEWERNYFKPIVIADKAVIHASFHTDVPAAPYDIVIDPKMAFGTGHHSTTSLIATRLLDMDLEGRSVIDMGTGTGILAILAAMRGASRIDAIEIDEAAWLNACDNVRLNGHDEINVILGDASALAGLDAADLLVANINRNIITADMAEYVKAIKKGGQLIFSGFYVQDIPVVRDCAEKLGLTFVDYNENLNWVSLRFNA